MSRTNRRPQPCSRCGVHLAAGEGDLWRCLGDGAGDCRDPEHYDDGGWHVTCLDAQGCQARAAERRAGALRVRDTARAAAELAAAELAAEAEATKAELARLTAGLVCTDVVPRGVVIRPPGERVLGGRTSHGSWIRLETTTVEGALAQRAEHDAVTRVWCTAAQAEAWALEAAERTGVTVASALLSLVKVGAVRFGDDPGAAPATVEILEPSHRWRVAGSIVRQAVLRAAGVDPMAPSEDLVPLAREALERRIAECAAAEAPIQAVLAELATVARPEHAVRLRELGAGHRRPTWSGEWSRPAEELRRMRLAESAERGGRAVCHRAEAVAQALGSLRPWSSWPASIPEEVRTTLPPVRQVLKAQEVRDRLLDRLDRWCAEAEVPPVSTELRRQARVARLQEIRRNIAALSSAQRALLDAATPDLEGEDRGGELAQLRRTDRLWVQVTGRQRRTASKLLEAGLVDLDGDRMRLVDDALAVVLDVDA